MTTLKKNVIWLPIVSSVLIVWGMVTTYATEDVIKVDINSIERSLIPNEVFVPEQNFVNNKEYTIIKRFLRLTNNAPSDNKRILSSSKSLLTIASSYDQYISIINDGRMSSNGVMLDNTDSDYFNVGQRYLVDDIRHYLRISDKVATPSLQFRTPVFRKIKIMDLNSITEEGYNLSLVNDFLIKSPFESSYVSESLKSSKIKQLFDSELKALGRLEFLSLEIEYKRNVYKIFDPPEDKKNQIFNLSQMVLGVVLLPAMVISDIYFNPIQSIILYPDYSGFSDFEENIRNVSQKALPGFPTYQSEIPLIGAFEIGGSVSELKVQNTLSLEPDAGTKTAISYSHIVNRQPSSMQSLAIFVEHGFRKSESGSNSRSTVGFGNHYYGPYHSVGYGINYSLQTQIIGLFLKQDLYDKSGNNLTLSPYYQGLNAGMILGYIWRPNQYFFEAGLDFNSIRDGNESLLENLRVGFYTGIGMNI